MQAKVVLVTGALTGVGQATALAFAREEGAHVVVSGRREDAGKALEDSSQRRQGSPLIPTKIAS